MSSMQETGDIKDQQCESRREYEPYKKISRKGKALDYESRRLDTAKLINKVIENVFGKGPFTADIYEKLRMLRYELSCSLEIETLKWEASIRNDYEKNKAYKRKNQDGSYKTDYRGRKVYYS